VSYDRVSFRIISVNRFEILRIPMNGGDI